MTVEEQAVWEDNFTIMQTRIDAQSGCAICARYTKWMADNPLRRDDPYKDLVSTEREEHRTAHYAHMSALRSTPGNTHFGTKRSALECLIPAINPLVQLPPPNSSHQQEDNQQEDNDTDPNQPPDTYRLPPLLRGPMFTTSRLRYDRGAEVTYFKVGDYLLFEPDPTCKEFCWVGRVVDLPGEDKKLAVHWAENKTLQLANKRVRKPPSSSTRSNKRQRTNSSTAIVPHHNPDDDFINPEAYNPVGRYKMMYLPDPATNVRKPVIERRHVDQIIMKISMTTDMRIYDTDYKQAELTHRVGRPSARKMHNEIIFSAEHEQP